MVTGSMSPLTKAAILVFVVFHIVRVVARASPKLTRVRRHSWRSPRAPLDGGCRVCAAFPGGRECAAICGRSLGAPLSVGGRLVRRRSVRECAAICGRSLGAPPQRTRVRRHCWRIRECAAFCGRSLGVPPQRTRVRRHLWAVAWCAAAAYASAPPLLAVACHVWS